MASVPQPSIGAARQDLYRRMDKHNLAPLWEVLHDLITHKLKLADINQGFELMHEGKSIRSVVVF